MKRTSQLLFVLYLLVVLIAGMLAPNYYIITRNTISELGAQGFPNAWLMRAGFFILGSAVTAMVFALSKTKRWSFLQASALMGLLIYAGALFILGWWSDKNFFVLDHNLDSFLHEFFYRISLLFFLLSVTLNAMVVKDKNFIILSVFTFCAVLILRYLFSEFVDYQGITERMMQVVVVYWLLKLNSVPEYFFSKIENDMGKIASTLVK
ncbi:MAG: DUF998 domain-containing protein [Deferribacteres bacterium]|nr:DUF998 domain-containing protein [Deferribacteres bacterium]